MDPRAGERVTQAFEAVAPGSSVLVTGAAGFIGSNIVRAAAGRGARVHAMVRPGSSLGRIEDLLPSVQAHSADLTDPASLRSLWKTARPDVVFHCAMKAGHPASPEAREIMLRNGVLGTLHLLETAASMGARRIVHLASSLEYAPSPSSLREDHQVDPVSFRGAVKAAELIVCRQIARERRLPLVVLRLFSVYGPWESPRRFIPSAIRAALEGTELPLTPPGVRRDFVYVEDVVEACFLAVAAETPPGEVFNVGSGKVHANEEVIASLEHVTGRTIRARPGEHPVGASDAARGPADCAKAQEAFGWAPSTPLEAGLEASVEWWRSVGRRNRVTS